MSKEISLSQGMVATVDDKDYEYLIQWKWSYGNHGYAVRRLSKTNKLVLMHRILMNAGPDDHVDHIDCDKLNNRWENLRICVPHLNLRNTKKHADNTSGYKGVSWNKNAKKWHAQIKYNKTKRVHIGYFDDVTEAAKAYNKAARKYHGEFARLNEI